MVSTSKAVEDNKQRKSSFDVGGSSAPRAFDSDAILQSLGFGWFQVKFLVFMAYGLAFPQAAIFVYNFLGATIPHRCFIEGCDDLRLLRNQTPRFVDPAINVTTGQPLDGWMGPAILGALAADMNRTVDERTWKCSYQRGLFNQTPPCANRESYIPGQACSKGWVYLTNSQDDRVPIQSSITTDFDLVCDDSWKPTFGNFLTLLGLLVGTIFLAPLPDIIGRKKAMGMFTIMMCAFGIGSAFAPNWDGFAGMRFLTGMGGQPALMAFGLWGMEAMAPSMRFPFYCAMAIASAIGNCLSGLAAYLIRDWSTLQLVIFVPFTCILVCQFFLPESARWLASKKRYEEAKKIFTDAAKLNKVTIPPQLLVIPGDEAGEETTNPFRMFGEILRTPCLLKRVFILFCAWFAQLSLNYGLASASTNLDNGLGPYVNYVLVMVVDFPSIAVVVVVVYFLGRRIIMNIGLIGGGISCLIAGLVEDNETVTVTFANLGKFFSTMFATTNYVMTAELFPTPARGIATAAITTAGKIGSIVSPYISNLGSTDQRLPYIIYGAIALFAGLLTLFLPETKDLPMPNTVQEAKDLERTNLKWSSFTFWKKNKATHQFSQ